MDISEFSKSKARSKLLGVPRTSAIELDVPAGGYRIINSPGKVDLVKLIVRPSIDMVCELVRDEGLGDFVFRESLPGGVIWSVPSLDADTAFFTGQLKLVLRNKRSVVGHALVNLSWEIQV